MASNWQQVKTGPLSLAHSKTTGIHLLSLIIKYLGGGRMRMKLLAEVATF